MTAKRDCSGKAWHNLGNWGKRMPCNRSATVQHDGKWYCWQHDPERVEIDKKKRHAAWDARHDREAAKYERIARNARLGALVTVEMAELLERLGTAWTETLPDDGNTALTLAAQIREALDEH